MVHQVDDNYSWIKQKDWKEVILNPNKLNAQVKKYLDEETLGKLTGWIHNNHFTDNKRINNMTVDIGQNKDWSISDFKEDRHTTIDGKRIY